MRIITDSDRTIRVIGINNKQVIRIIDNDASGFVIEYEADTKNCKQFTINCNPNGIIINDKKVDV